MPTAVPTTTLGRTAALEALRARREANKDRESINNSRLPAGSPMYFECLSCRADIVVPEEYLTRPKLCDECAALKELGWLSE